MQDFLLSRYPFRAILDRPVRADEEDALLFFYLPIMGNASFSLYHLLKREAEERTSGPSRTQRTHRWLLSMLGMSREECLEARYRLEGLGLLQTFLSYTDVRNTEFGEGPSGSAIFEYLGSSSDETATCASGKPSSGDGDKMNEKGYLYRVIPPLSPADFFDSDVLSVLLLNSVGEAFYDELRSRFVKEDYSPKSAYVNVSQSFQNVFPPLTRKELSQVPQKPQRPLKEQLQKLEVKGPAGFDLAWMKVRMGRVFQVENWWNREAEQRILELAYLYRLNEEEMARLLQEHLFSREAVDWDLLRLEVQQRAGKSTAIERGGGLHTTVWKAGAEAKTANQKAISDAQRHRQDLEQISPYALLQAYQQGGKVAESDRRLVQSLIEDFQLSEPVINVLIEYVMFTNEYKLPRALVEKVAGHWKRLGINSVEEAQHLCRKEHQIYRSWPGSKGQKSPRKSMRKEPVPQAIREQIKQNHHNPPSVTGVLPEESGQAEHAAGHYQEEEKKRLMQEKEERARALLQALGELKKR